jgi:hypothetical protein
MSQDRYKKVAIAPGCDITALLEDKKFTHKITFTQC